MNSNTSRIVLALKPQESIDAIAQLLAQRFAGTSIELYLISVLPNSLIGSASDTQSRTTQSLLAALKKNAERLRALDCVVRVQTQLAEGAVAEQINSYALRVKADAVLMHRAQQRGLLSSLGLTSVTRRVCQQASYPVEVLKQESKAENTAYRVLVPVTEENLDYYPVEKLVEHPFPHGACLRFLALLPPQLGDDYAETSAIAAVRAVDTDSARNVRMGSRLSKLCAALQENLDPSIKVDYQLTRSGSSSAAIQECNRLNADLLVMPNQTTESFMQGSQPALSPAAMLMAARCSVLMLGHSLPRNFGKANRVLAMPNSHSHSS